MANERKQTIIEHGTEFDPSSVTGPEVTYELRGLGAEIVNAQ